MKLALIRVAIIALTVVAVTGAAMRAQAPQGTNTGLQVAVPEGSTQDQDAAAARRQQQQQARAKLANQPPPRTADRARHPAAFSALSVRLARYGAGSLARHSIDVRRQPSGPRGRRAGAGAGGAR